MDFGKCQDRFGRFSWSKNDSNYLDIKLKVSKGEDKNAEFRLSQIFSMGEADFNQFIRQRNQLVVAADNFLREENLSPVLQSTLSKDMEEQLKLVHNAPPPTTPESVRSNEPPRLLRSRAFGARIENVPDYVYRNLFE